MGKKVQSTIIGLLLVQAVLLAAILVGQQRQANYDAQRDMNELRRQIILSGPP